MLSLKQKKLMGKFCGAIKFFLIETYKKIHWVTVVSVSYFMERFELLEDRSNTEFGVKITFCFFCEYGSHWHVTIFSPCQLSCTVKQKSSTFVPKMPISHGLSTFFFISLSLPFEYFFDNRTTQFLLMSPGTYCLSPLRVIIYAPWAYPLNFRANRSRLFSFYSREPW